MKTKQIVQFYFAADSLDRALDNLILNSACRSADYERGCAYYAEKIGGLIDAKRRLGELWLYLDGVVGTLDSGEKEILRLYGRRGRGAKPSDGEKRELKRVVVKFNRRARCLCRHAEGLALLKRYYCLLRRDAP